MKLKPLSDAPGPTKGAAFFDVDNTLINIKSMFSFWTYLKSEYSDILGEPQGKHEADLLDSINGNACREEVNRRYYRLFEGLEVDVIAQAGRQWFQRHAQQDDFYIGKSVERLNHHKQTGESVVFVSGSFSALLSPIASTLGVDNVICSDLEIINGRYTGKLVSEPTIGQGKRNRIIRFAAENDVNLAMSYAYGDDVSDIPMLACVGHPRLVNPQPEAVTAFCSNHKHPDRIEVV